MVFLVLFFSLYRKKIGDESLKMYRKKKLSHNIHVHEILGVIRHFHAEIVKWTSEGGDTIGQSCETRWPLETRDAATGESIPVSSNSDFFLTTHLSSF